MCGWARARRIQLAFALVLLVWGPAAAAPTAGGLIHQEEPSQVQPSVTRRIGMSENYNSPRNVYVYEPISEDDPEERTIVDIMPHIGSFIFRGFVRRVLIKPVLGRFKRLIPSDFYSYYQQKLLKRRFFKIMSPLSPLVSSYAYNKFEQGIFWTLKRGYTYVSDNFIEWERPGEDGELVDSEENEEREEEEEKRKEGKGGGRISQYFEFRASLFLNAN